MKKRKEVFEPIMANKKMSSETQSDTKIAKEIGILQKHLNDLMKSEQTFLQGKSEERQSELTRLHNRFLNMVNMDMQDAIKRKSPNQSTYDYIASAITGRGRMNPNDPSQKSALRQDLQRLFSGGDMEISSYFLSNGINSMQIYDEIDSICAYMYQLDEAVDIIRDNVVASEEVSESLSMDIKFRGMSDEESVEYKEDIITMFRDEGLSRKLKSHTLREGIKYGKTFMMFIPHYEIGERLSNIRGGMGMTESVALFEQASADQKNSEKSNTDNDLRVAMESVAELLDIEIAKYDKWESDPKGYEFGKDESEHSYIAYDRICENLKSLTVCENEEPPNVTGFSYDKLKSMDDHVLDVIKKAMDKSNKDTKHATNPRKGSKEYADGLIDPTKMDGVKGCYIKMVDPREMAPIKIFDYTIGYYYCENFNYEYAGTNITDLLSNTMRFDQKTQTIDRLVDSVLGRLKYGDILSGDTQFRKLILNCLLYTEQRDNPLRIKFVPCEYVVEFKTNLDKNENGQPVLLRSLFFARLYISLLLFYITAIITKSTDSEFYYMNESAIEPSYENQVADIMDQLQECNVDPIAIANGYALNASKAINKRYFMSMGTSGNKAFDIDVMSGQNIDIHNEFLTELKKMAVSSTSVASVMVDAVDEIEYASMLSMLNIKNMRRTTTIQEDFNPSITEAAKILAKHTTNIPDDVIDKLYITLRPPRNIQNNISSNQLNDNAGLSETMVKSYYRGEESSGDLSEFDKRVMDAVKRSLMMYLSPSAPWEKMDGFIEDAKIRVRKEMEEDKMKKQHEENSEE